MVSAFLPMINSFRNSFIHQRHHSALVGLSILRAGSGIDLWLLYIPLIIPPELHSNPTRKQFHSVYPLGISWTEARMFGRAEIASFSCGLFLAVLSHLTKAFQA